MSNREMSRYALKEARLSSVPRSRREKERELLARWNAGEPEALENLTSYIFSKLVGMAERPLRREAAPCEPEELVTELYLRLREIRRPNFVTTSSFYGFVAATMRRILIDRARARIAEKRGGGLKRVDLRSTVSIEQPSLEDAIHLEYALEKLDPTLASLVKLRFFMGLTMPEVAEALGWSNAKVTREWSAAKLQLQNLLLEPTLRGTTESGSETSPSVDIVKPIITLELVSPELIRALSLHPELMKTLDWRAFEYLLATILEKLEYEIELQRGTKDGGIDIFAIKRDGPFGLNRYLLQAKRWSRAVDVRPIREILFLHHEHRVTKSCLATTSRFTRGAWKIANEYRWVLELRDYKGLQEWLHLCEGQQIIAPAVGNVAAGLRRR